MCRRQIARPRSVTIPGTIHLPGFGHVTSEPAVTVPAGLSLIHGGPETSGSVGVHGRLGSRELPRLDRRLSLDGFTLHAATRAGPFHPAGREV
jgi:hypothetical protein